MGRKAVLWFGSLWLLAGCGDGGLDTLDGPKSGKVSGLLCDELEVLAAAKDSTVLQMMKSSGACVEIPGTKQKQVDVIRTVMMPGDGKYSQVNYSDQGKMKKLWVKTSSIKADAK